MMCLDCLSDFEEKDDGHVYCPHCRKEYRLVRCPFGAKLVKVGI